MKDAQNPNQSSDEKMRKIKEVVLEAIKNNKD